ncbi:uncharacterized protein [Diadema setosum]|uniref:uncharacterized protein n=1 Tax=Diadema setosum TaxID=31175 RepID=UPI003B3A5360
MMGDTFVPFVQVECNVPQPRHEQGIPRFIHRSGGAAPIVPSPGVLMTTPPEGVVTIDRNANQPLAVFTTSKPRLPMAPPNLQPPTYPQFGCGIPGSQGVPYGSCDGPQSPSQSSSTSSVSVYEDCMSLPASSPRQHMPATFGSKPDTFTGSGIRYMPQHGPDSHSQPFSDITLGRTPSLGSVSSDHSGQEAVAADQATSIKPEQAMTMVNEKLRDKIADLEKQLQRALVEGTFLGDRNWRLEAYLDSLMHTMELLNITDVEDLTGKSLPLPMFRVKVKAGYRLGPFNRLPRRAVWSFEEDGKASPNIDLSADRATTLPPEKTAFLERDDFQVPPGSDIGLSVQQMFHYESQIEELRRQNHELSARLGQSGKSEQRSKAEAKESRRGDKKLRAELQKTKNELQRVQQRLIVYEDRTKEHASMPHPDDFSDRGSESSSSWSTVSSSSHGNHLEQDYRACDGREVNYQQSSRPGPYYRRTRAVATERGGRKYRDFRGRHGGSRRTMVANYK